MTSLRLALVGAPNSGKSTLFNGLTGGRAKTANYPGVTVERRSGVFATPGGRNFEIIDLPGIYGLSPRSMDERIAVETIRAGSAVEAAPDVLLVLIDAADLRTHLHFAMQLRELGRPMILALNMMDLAVRDGVKIDVPALEAKLGVPVVSTTAPRRAGREALLARLDAMIEAGLVQPPSVAGADLKTLQRQARQIADSVILAEPGVNKFTRAADSVLLHPVLGLFILAAILFAMFQAVFTFATGPMDAIDAAMIALHDWVQTFLPDGWVKGLITDGIIAGVGSVIIFLPQIIILFCFILLLEASGYMARAAFLMDQVMYRVGLNGRAFIPLLSSFACAIPGMMAARTIEGERDRLTTIAVAPLMTCSARLPVYTLLIAAFIPATNVGPFGLQGVVMFVLYLAGVLSAFIVAWILKRTAARGPSQPLMMELPTYKWPDPKDFVLNLWGRAWAFLRRAGTLILSTSIVLWVLVSFPVGADDIRNSYAGMIGGVLEHIFRPIGFNLEISIALVPGMAAREVAVGALGTVYAVQNADTDTASLAQALSASWSLPTALALLAWYVYAPQCLATLAVARRETNSWTWTGLMFGYLFALAYVAAGATYWIARAAGL